MDMRAQASPNIAFIKYWGKKEDENSSRPNIALNPSLSMTLSKAKTTTEFRPLTNSESTSICINNQIVDSKDQEKITKHIHIIYNYFKQKVPDSFFMESENNFPMAAGIASSASAFAALSKAVCLQILGEDEFKNLPLRELSKLARMGSGSACRSVGGPFMLWEKEEYATEVPSNWLLYDTIIMLDKNKKKVSSRQAHKAVAQNPAMQSRQEQIPKRLEQSLLAIKNQELKMLGPILETEALEIHELAGSCQSPINYLNPDSRIVLQALQSIEARDFYFTLDAGPNIHIISERSLKSDLKNLLNSMHIDSELWEDKVELND